MPNRDGTGPCGMGPATGRGGGRQGRFNLFVRPGGRGITAFAAIVPLVGALIKDITNPNGIVRYVMRKLLGQRKTPYRNKAINASYTIISEEDTNQEKGRPEQKQ